MGAQERTDSFRGDRAPLVGAVERFLGQDQLNASAPIDEFVGSVLNQLFELPTGITALDRESLRSESREPSPDDCYPKTD